MLSDPQSVWEYFFIFGDIPAIAEKGTYIMHLVALSYLIASMGSFAGLRIASDIRNASVQKTRKLLHLAGAFAFGASIWSMHFIGMLAYDMDMVVTYDTFMTMMSMVIAILIAYGVLAVVKSGRLNFIQLAASALLLGLAICTMHYMGMAAMDMDGDLRYRPLPFIVSFIIAITASGAALWIVFTLGHRQEQGKLKWQALAAIVMGAAVCGMHYMGVEAAVFLPWADCRYDPDQSFEGLALTIATIVSLILGTAMAIAFYAKEKALSGREEQDVFPEKFLLTALVLTMISAAWMASNSFYNYRRITDDLRMNIEAGKLANAMMITEANQAVIMQEAATSGALESENEYKENDALIRQMHKSLSENYNDPDEENSEGFSAKIEQAYASRSQMEQKMFDLLRQGEVEQAHKVIESELYRDSKHKLIAGHEEFVREIYEAESNEVLRLTRNMYYSLYPVMMATAVLIVIWVFVFRRLRHWRQKLVETRNFLDEEKNYLNAILDATADGIYGLDKNGYTTIANRSAEKMLGYKLEEMLGRPQHDLINHTRADGSPYPAEECNVYKAIYKGESAHSEDEVFWRKDGTSFPVSYDSAPIVGMDGRIKGAVVCFHDITAQKEEELFLRHSKEVADRANEAKSDFLANMSHELRTPLNSIIGMTRMLVEDLSLSGDNRSMAEIVHKSSNNLLDIVNDILDISKIESGNMVLEEVGFDFKDAVANVMESMAPIASEKGISLEYHFHDEDIPYLVGDPLRVSRILTNLISNAIKYTDKGIINVNIDSRIVPAEETNIKKIDVDKGNVSVSVSTRTVSGEKVEIYCEVSDTGIGIPDDKLQTIFDKFSQADVSTTRKYGGTGLGLAITKDLVKMMGGSIGVTSEVGKGSTFWFKIPFDVTDDVESVIRTQEGRHMVRSTNDASIVAEKAKVLVAEDHLLNQDFIGRLLRRMGIKNIDLVENGLMAVNAFKEGDYDLILMDCHMPELNGYEATRKIRKSGSEKGKTIPIVALTADAMKGAREKVLGSGMDDYVSKPIDADEFRGVMAQWVIFGNRAGEKAGGKKGPDEKGAPVDMSLLEDYADTAEDMKNFIAVFLRQSEEGLEILAEHCVDGESREWVEAAHKLKGGSGMVGAKTLHKLCAQAQECAQGSAGERETLLKEIRAEYDRVKAYLRETVSA